MRFLSGYQLLQGSALERATLVKFLQRSYQELFPEQNYLHLAETVDRYLSNETPLWWVEFASKAEYVSQSSGRVACLWLGNSVDQVRGDRHAHIFLLYVMPEHRRRGIGTALMRHAEDWAASRGDRQISLQVFQNNQPALNLYRRLGYQPQSLMMVKSLVYKPPE